MKYYLVFSHLLFCITTLSAQQIIYKASGDQDSKITHLLALAAQKETEGDKKEATRFLNAAAGIAWEAQDYQQAIDLFQKSIQLNESIGNQSGILMIYNNLGMIYADIKEYDASLKYFLKTLDGRKIFGEKVNIISAHINSSVVLNKLNRFSEAVYHLEEALSLAREMSDAQQMRSCYGMLAETYEKMGNNEKMMHYFNLYRTFHEVELKGKEKKYKEITEKAILENKILETEKRNKELALENAQLNLNKQEKEIQQKTQTISAQDRKVSELTQRFNKQELALQILQKDAKLKEQNAKLKELQYNQEKAKNELRAQRDTLIKTSLWIGALFLLLLTGVLYYRYTEKRKTNDQLAYQNKEILKQQNLIIEQKHQLQIAFEEIKEMNEDTKASIMYASRIQNAMLPKTETIAEFLPEHFVLFKPRDIVSGDFYWFAHKKDKIIIAAVDCTGHGVPGAFVSMIGDSLLNQIVHDKKILSPEKILNELHLGVKNQLNQSQTQNKDGMDIAICVIDTKKKKIEFAGAHNPLIYIQKQQLYEVKGDRLGIGGYLRREGTKRQFTKHTIKISQPTIFYLFSDGYQDQFGGVEKRKFMIKRLKELFLEIHSLPMNEQAVYLENVMKDWQQGQQQIDDMLIIGVKV